MFLEILGVIFLIVICVVLKFVWKIYRLTKLHENSDISTAISVLPSQYMELEPSGKEDWQEKEQLAYMESELKRLGASNVGYYCVYSGYATIRIAMWDYKQKAVIAIYEAFSEQDKKNVSFIYEVACKLEDGSLCITSNPHAAYDNRPQNHKMVFNEAKSIIDFIRSIKSQIPEGKKLFRIKDPKEFFTESYEATAEWAWRPEQLKSDKTQQTFASVGVDVSEELMEQLIEMGTSYSIEVNVNRARRRLARQSKMSVSQWEKVRDQLVFVNEKMQVEHLIDAVYDLASDLTEQQEQVLDGFQEKTKELTDPIGAFQMLLQALNLKAKRITSMNSPVKTEVYLPL